MTRACLHAAITLVLSILVAVPSLAAGVASSKPHGVSFATSPRGHVLVPVSVGGERLVFSLDTGAGRTSITSAAAEKLGLPEIPGETVKMMGVHGLTEHPVVRMRSLALGEDELLDQEAVVFDLDHITRGKWHVDGLLGMDFLQHFDLRFDFPAETVALFPRATDPDDCAGCPSGVEGTVFGTIEPGFVVLPLTVDGRPVRAVLDTGSGHSGLNTKAAESLGVELPAAPPIGAAGVGGHGFGLQTGPLRLGEQVLNERPTLRVMDHPVMEALGLADGPAMLMGTDQLAGRTLTISYGLGRVFVE
jgi:predicted aspartyl protease